MKYRTMTGIVAQILQVAAQGEGASRSHIAYKALLTFKQLKDYMPLLMEEGFLIDYGSYGTERLYKTSKKGDKFLQIYRCLAEYLPIGPQN